MVNRVILIGHLGQDPEIRTLEAGTMVAKLSVATNENYKDRNGEWQTNTEWHDVVAWRSLADRAQSQLTKGSQVYVEGKLTHRSWEDQQGNKRYSTEVVANYFRKISDPRERSDYEGSSSGQSSTPMRATSESPTAPVAPTNSSAPAVEDDLPF